MHRQKIFPLLSRRGIEGEVNQINFMKIYFKSYFPAKIKVFFYFGLNFNLIELWRKLKIYLVHFSIKRINFMYQLRECAFLIKTDCKP